MQLEVFRKSICMACGRLSEELGYCPWCGAGMGCTRSTLLRITAAILAGVLLLFQSAIPNRSAFLLVATLFAAAVVSVSAPDSRSRLRATAAAMAGSALCHACPETVAEIGLRLKLHIAWILPAASLVFACSGGATLPPVPSASTQGRLWQALKTPVVVMCLASIAAVAAWMPNSPASLATMALCYGASFHSAKHHPGLSAATVFLFTLTFCGPDNVPLHSLLPSTAFAVSIAVFGLAQTFIEMKRTASDPSIHP